MSNSKDNLVLHLKLDEIVEEGDDRKVSDALTGSKYNVKGDPLVVTDENFGSCLSFDGNGDYIELIGANDLGLKDSSFTVEVWINAQEVSGGDKSILGNDEQFANNSLHLIIRNKKPYLGFYNNDTSANKEISENSWYHITWRYHKDNQEQAIFVDGVLDNSDTNHTAFQGNGIVRIGRWLSGNYFKGKIAHVRIYNKALSPEEIQQDMNEDLRAIASFNKTHPLDFNLYEGEDKEPVIFIENGTKGQELTLEIVNNSDQPITLPTKSGAVSKANHHFELRFRPDTLSPDSLEQLDWAGKEGWSMSSPVTQADSKVSLYLIRTNNQALGAKETIPLTLQQINGAAAGGARTTRVELKCPQFTDRGETFNNYYREKRLSIISHRGKKHIPLHVGFVGSNLILNDGSSPNQLILRITNVLKDETISLKPASKGDEASKFIISFDVDTDWALGTKSQVGKIAIAGKDWRPDEKPEEDWNIDPDNEGETPTWTITHQNEEEAGLAPGQVVQLTITNIISSLSSGHANLYVRYENIPGYWDGTFVCTIEKSPIVFNKLGNVGIGTNPPLSYEIYLRGSAFESTEGNKTYLKINNLSVPMTTNRGLNTVIFSPEGSYKTGTSHDVYGNANNWNDWADWINDANNVANGDVVAVASYDAIWNAPSEGSAQTLLTSINALKAFAVEQGDTPQPRFPYALLFIKGKTGAIEVAQPYKGPNAHIKTTYYKLFNYGNSSVEYKLDVNGNTNVNGTIYRGGNPLIYENYEIYLRGSAHESTEGNHNYLKIANVSIPMTTNRGLNTVILSPDGTYKTGNSHDVYDGNANNWNAWADWINDANNVANGDVVAVASFDAIKNAPSGGRAETLLRSINALKAFAAVQSHPRSPYALLFIKGKTGAIEVAQPYRGSNAHIKTTYYELFNYGNSSVVLRGMIMMWSGSKDHIPVGWALCDGTNGTPNLRDRFIVGAGSSYEVNGQGGQDTVTLTEQQMPSHLHSGSAQSGEHRHVIPVDTGGGGEGWGQARMIQAGVYNNPNNVANANTYAYTFGGFVSQWTPNSAPKEGKGEHTHNLAIARSGGGQGHENRPPYYALAYIMKL